MYEKRYSNNADSERVKLESDVEDSYDIYPHPTVRVVRPKVISHSSWKEALTQVTHKRTLLGVLAVLMISLLLLILIVFMVQGNPQSEDPDGGKNYGLVAYPSVGQEQVINFKPDEYDSFRTWMDQIEEALYPYTPQRLSSERYINCDLRDRQGEEQCTFHIFDLGLECSHGKDFGFSSGKPCVLLQLNLPFRPGTVDKTSETWKKLYQTVGTRWNPNFVSVTCDGKTATDKDNLRHNLPKPMNETAMTFTPVTGFPLAYFPSDLEDDIYLAPLMMVQFRSLKPFRETTVECIVWAQDKDGNLPEVSQLYRTEFKLQLQ
ncbi:sodium/potassium-transporting ATPase subunit beta-like [Liolophura sinensis]|uniref:sodium/potassium-transporting ATPase subunit beta-like n=1 Tax=Liolophura sinensis TaxID=3198878 RepID=UPI003159604E